jgi:DNA-binding beta-propeller fold protein YncE
MLLGVPGDLTVSLDGKNVYVLDSGSEGVVLTLARSPVTGRLTLE